MKIVTGVTKTMSGWILNKVRDGSAYWALRAVAEALLIFASLNGFHVLV